MKKTHCLIEFRFHGYTKKYLKKLIFEVSKKFRVKGVTRKHVVPHITLFGPFSTKYEKKMISEVVAAVKNYHLVPFKLTGFGHFDKQVIFVNVEPSEELKKLRRDIAQRLLPITRHEKDKIRKVDSGHDFAFHGTVAFKDIERKFDKIWGYLKEKEEPDINQHLLRVSIIKNQRILYEYDLMQKKLLNRRQALSKDLWIKTIKILKKQLSAKEGICGYHLCQKKAKVYKCEYCDGYFCKEHLQPKLPRSPYYGTTRKEKRLMLEYQEPSGGHPCAPYIDVWQTEQKRKKREQHEALDRFIKSKPLREKTHTPEPLDWMDRIKPKLLGEEPEREDDTIRKEEKPKQVIRKKTVIERLQSNLHSYVKPFFDGLLAIPKYIIGLLIWLIISKIVNIIFLEIGFTIEPYAFLFSILFYGILFFFFPYLLYKFIKNSPEELEEKIPYIIGGVSFIFVLYLTVAYLLPLLPSGNIPRELAKGVNVNLNVYQYYFYSSLNKPPYPFFMEYITQIDVFDNYLFKKNIYREIINEIRSDYPEISDDQLVVVLVSLVQDMDYDYSKLNDIHFQVKFPYETLYTNKGVCIEKSYLLIRFLKELNYNVALMTFYDKYANPIHAGVGIKCTYPNFEEFCYIETTLPGWYIGQVPPDFIGYTPSMIKYGGLKTL